jgi:hypothetical protein
MRSCAFGVLGIARVSVVNFFCISTTLLVYLPLWCHGSRAEEQRNKRKLVDRKRRETTRKCVDQLVDLVGGFELGDKQPNVTSVLAATVRFIEETQKGMSRLVSSRLVSSRLVSSRLVCPVHSFIPEYLPC